MISVFRLVAACAFLSCAFPVAAHHSSAAYDAEHPQTFEGTVSSVNWSNPHITFRVVADGKGGQPGDEWVFEVSSPGVLTRSGWTKRSLQPGDHATFQFDPLRDGTHGGYLRKVTLPGGSVLTYSLSPSEQ
jgi:hypothetical protein